MVRDASREAETGYLRERAVLNGQERAVLAKQLLNGRSIGFHYPQVIIVRQDVCYVAVGKVAGMFLRTDASSVSEGDVRTGINTVSVANQVAEIRLAHADLLFALFVEYTQAHVTMTNNALSQFAHQLLYTVCSGFYARTNGCNFFSRD